MADNFNLDTWCPTSEWVQSPHNGTIDINTAKTVIEDWLSSSKKHKDLDKKLPRRSYINQIIACIEDHDLPHKDRVNSKDATPNFRHWANANFHYQTADITEIGKYFNRHPTFLYEKDTGKTSSCNNHEKLLNDNKLAPAADSRIPYPAVTPLEELYARFVNAHVEFYLEKEATHYGRDATHARVIQQGSVSIPKALLALFIDNCGCHPQHGTKRKNAQNDNESNKRQRNEPPAPLGNPVPMVQHSPELPHGPFLHGVEPINDNQAVFDNPQPHYDYSPMGNPAPIVHHPEHQEYFPLHINQEEQASDNFWDRLAIDPSLLGNLGDPIFDNYQHLGNHAPHAEHHQPGPLLYDPFLIGNNPPEFDNQAPWETEVATQAVGANAVPFSDNEDLNIFFDIAEASFADPNDLVD